MKFFPFNQNQKKAQSPHRAKQSGDKKTQLTLQLDEINRRKRLLEQTIEEIPKKLEDRKRREERLIKDRAKKHKSVQGLDSRNRGVRLNVQGLSWEKMTRSEKRASLNRLFLLIAVLGIALFLLFKSVR